jgi:hypothetical protein
MTDRATDGVEAEVRRALTTLEASAERVYYDADADARVRTSLAGIAAVGF